MSRFFIVSCVDLSLDRSISNIVTSGVFPDSVSAQAAAKRNFVERYECAPRTTAITQEYSIEELQDVILQMQREARS